MTTFRAIVTRALTDINALEIGEQAEATLAADALQRLQQMMAGWEADGLELHLPAVGAEDPVAYPVPDTPFSLNDDWPLGQLHVQGITAMLAAELAPSYGHTLTRRQEAAAAIGRRRLNADFYPDETLSPDPALARTSRGTRSGFCRFTTAD